ncbi:sulfurtransferase-like selenium metabolism protein YedF [Clostridium sp. KNHs214]|uniref:sulfurtransferase-like selenium metabolism protein YedF n=1 Tax=Clostridium sp. KNHs214 TaxID=1540257 RepID=UPI000555584E|nr:sulfurtransferase-like selenium metabolism protein YedF [Clostridium sp. KNHs214]
MAKIIDCKGMNCPIPVVSTKKYFDSIESGEATTVVDNEVAKNNVLKFAQNNGFEANAEEKEGFYYVNIVKGEGSTGCKEENKGNKNTKFTIAIMDNKLGNGHEDLGNILIKSYLFALSEADVIPTDLIFVNAGVKLTVEGSEVLESLSKLEERGVKIQVCGTCLDFYKIKEQLKIGEISNMYSIVETMNTSDKIVKL